MEAYRKYFTFQKKIQKFSFFYGCGPQNWVTPKSTFCHNLKNISHRKACNTSTEAYFNDLLFSAILDLKIISKKNLGGFRVLGSKIPNKKFFLFLIKRFLKSAFIEVLHAFLWLIFFKLWPKVDFGVTRFWVPHP